MDLTGIKRQPKDIFDLLKIFVTQKLIFKTNNFNFGA
jgi:hypothetical protein